MTLKTYMQATLINISLVLVGAMLSPMIVNSVHAFRGVHAQESKTTPPPQSSPSTPANATTPQSVQAACDDAHFECVSPSISTGAAVFGIVLANKIGCDHLQVNGYDVLKIEDVLIGTLQAKGIFLQRDVDSIVSAGKIEKPLRMKPR